MNIELLKERVGYDGKPQQWQYGFDLAIREMQALEPLFSDINEIDVNSGLSGYGTPALIGTVEVVLYKNVNIYMEHDAEQDYRVHADCSDAYREEVETAVDKHIMGLRNGN